MAKKKELVFCWLCARSHTYEPCPKCGQKKWSLEYEKNRVLTALKEFFQQQKGKKKTKKELEMTWKAVTSTMDDVLFTVLLIGRHEAQMCDCTKNALLDHYAGLDIE